MKRMRALTLVLTLSLLLSVVSVVNPTPALAADDYPYKNDSWTTVDPWGFFKRECVSFVAWRMRQAGASRNGVLFKNYWGTASNGLNHWGNAYEWDNYAAALGYAVNTTPSVGAVAQWNQNEGGTGSFGHVAYVSAIAPDGSVTIEEYNGSNTHVYRQRSGVRAPRYIHITGAGAPAAHNPKGHYDAAGSPQAGTVAVRGWAFDDDAKTSAIDVHVYVGGEAGVPGAEGKNIGPASASRPDVGAAFPGAGDNHGFEASFETGKRGSQPVCVYAINVGGGSNVLLGCKTVTIANPNPFGHLDSTTSPDPGTVRVRGWAVDPNDRTNPIGVHIYIGGPAGVGRGYDIGSANAFRPDVNAVHTGVGDNHGFDKTLTDIAAGTHEVCAYGINVGAGTNTVLSACTTVTVKAPPTQPPPTEPPPTEPPPTEPPQTEPPQTEPPGSGSPEFSDIANSPHRASIEAVAAAGIASGFPDGMYRPNAEVTRGQMATFLARALSLSSSEPSSFRDVSSSAHRDAIAALVNVGIAGGFPDGTFRPNAPVTRGQMATFVARAWKLSFGQVGAFTDVANSPHRDGISAVAEAGIAGGFPDGSFRPNDPVTRGQTATFIHRAKTR